ncbi:hypothetical protein CMI37_38630 [Candidatus Pacearchaeota archaeon]|jgi:Holliday junction resolvase|nr:hypothetical protein [Candidatus Pacearchaeota archaeon]|tara:strand:+ start:1008 stop:1262 length:255 start_codon:yes stop_codon:yes gene_type:complete
MPNRNYEKGIRYEREIVNQAKEEGYTAFRTAGSKSPVDVCIVDDKGKRIYLIQCKVTKRSQKKLKETFDKIETGYRIIWKVMEK